MNKASGDNRVPEDTENLLNALIEELGKRCPRVKLDSVESAFRFSAAAHKGQLRKSGEPFVTHCTQVATILVNLLERRMDTPLVCSSLLHDVIEDGNVTSAQIEEEFGNEVAYLVDGVTKIGGFKFRSKEVEQAEYFRKMLLSMAKDVRVVLIKLADRLHNMRTLGALDEARILQTAEETRDIFAPLAHRLGIWMLKWELEDLAFKFLNPETYREIADKVAQAREDRERYVEEVRETVSKRLVASGIKGDVVGRPKHFASIYRKMKERNCRFEEIYDLIGIRIVATSKAECYRVLGIVHDLYAPVHDRFKDYIATPKSNMYQSLHTTVFGPKGEMVEFQIRSREMDRTAELGIAAHYSYKEGVAVGGELQKVRELLRRATEWQEDTSDPAEFLSLVKESLYHAEVFVFTPKGDVKHLPRGSTALDFAYAVHTEVGEHCVGAKLNGRLVPIKHVLESGDTIEIVTSPSARPSEDWLKILRSSEARSKVRHWLRVASQQDSISLGKEMLEKALRKNRLPAPDDLSEVVTATGFQTEDQLLASIGRGDLSIESVLLKISPPARPRIDKVFHFRRLRELTERRRHYVKIQGISNLMVSFAHCCEPIPGDRIIGIVTRGRGVSVHRIDCPNTFDDRIESGRRIDVEWEVGKESLFMVNLVVSGTDRQNLLFDIAKAISETNTNIKRSDMGLVDGEVKGRFVVEVQDLGHLERVMKAISKVRNVTRVERGQFLAESAPDAEPERKADR